MWSTAADLVNAFFFEVHQKQFAFSWAARNNSFTVLLQDMPGSKCRQLAVQAFRAYTKGTMRLQW